jgi:type II secretory pathway component PulF
MPKYKIVASKSQKKYTLIISADSPSQAKDKLHDEDYSILSIEETQSSEVSGKKFLFQIEHDGEVKNGVIVGKDIFKVYIKLVDDL